MGLVPDKNYVEEMVSDLKQKVSEMNHEMEALREKHRAYGKAIITKLFDWLLENAPEVGAVSWVQYTPYFNDGDACEFSVHEPGFMTLAEWEDEEKREEAMDDMYERDPFTRSRWGSNELYEETVKAYGQERTDYCSTVINEFCSVFRKLDNELFLYCYGDHVRVTVSRNGTEIEEYEHD